MWRHRINLFGPESVGAVNLPSQQFVFAASSYSNAAPLVECLEAVDRRVRVLFDHPSRLPTALRNKEADVALIPVAEYFRNPEFTLVEGLGVAADGEVRSVLLKCNVPVQQVTSVMKDPASATSNALAGLLLKHRFHRDAVMRSFREGAKVDAAVVIGDRALCSAPASGGDIDMGGAWKELTGLPFVFAVWAYRRDHPSAAEFAPITHAAYRAGALSLETIAARFAETLRRSTDSIHGYLTRCIRYEIGAPEREGMDCFRRMLEESAI